jgi:sugar lactone lactonase YvrE
MSHERAVITLNKTLSSGCELGEGLCVKKDKAAWVDINNNYLMVYEEGVLTCHSTYYKPSIVYNIKEDEVSLGSDVGLTVFNTKTKREAVLSDVSAMHNTKEYRSNDGGFCENYQFLSFMHRSNPEDNLGFVYRVYDESISLIDNSLHIPNSFIEIGPSEILISDSLKGQIWLYQLDKLGNVAEKTIWYEFEPGIAPDGGCLVGDLVFIALWDDAAIAVFDKGGRLLNRLVLPIIRPTNCKLDKIASQLWITSASEGLSKHQVSLYPASGHTLVYDLELRS